MDERILTRTKLNENGCLEWQRALMGGYGSMWLRGKNIYTHRYVWEQIKGPIPKGIHVLHRCDNRKCCNVDHLFLGTNADNIRDRNSKGRANFVTGTRSPWAKLTDCKVMEMKRLYRGGGYSGKRLATMYGVSYSSAWNAIIGKTWKHLL